MCGTPLFPRVLVHLVGLGPVVGQRRVVGGGQRAGPDLVPQFQQVFAADPDLARQLGGGDPLGDAAEDQEDLGRAEVCPLPLCSCEHIEHTSTPLAAVVGDRGVGVTAVDVEPRAGATPGAGEPFGVEQVGQLLTAPLLVHDVEDREVHGVGSGGRFVETQESRSVPD
jgi:hypothetical protein